MLEGSPVLFYLLILLTHSYGLGLIILAIGGLQVALLLATTARVQGLMQRDLSAQSESQRIPSNIRPPL